MKNNICTTTIFATSVTLAILTQSLPAKDTMVVKGKKYDGTFESMKNDKIHFLPDGGKTMHETRAFVEQLTINPPASAIVTPKGKKKTTDMKLKGYEKSNFIFDRNGESVMMPGMQITAIEMALDFDRAPGGAAASDNDSDNTGDKPLRIDIKDLSAWMKEGNATPAQTRAFESYKVARESYDRFVMESAVMVKAMDSAKGPAREDFLNKLRKRKNDEQPLLGALKSAEKELLTAFPTIKGPEQK